MSSSADRSSLLRGAVAASAGAAGFIHFFAASTHGAHALVASFFVVLGVAQLAWAGYALGRSSPVVLGLGAAMNASTVGLWLMSRTVGTPFIPGHTGREAVGALDVAATALEIVAVLGVLQLITPRSFERVRLYPRELTAAGVAVGLVVLALPPAIGTPIGGGEHAGHLAGHTLALHEITHAGHSAGSNVHSRSHPGHRGQHAIGHGTHGFHASDHAGHLAGTGRADHAGHAAHVHSAPAAAPLPQPRGVAATVKYGPFSLGPARVDRNKQVSPAVSNTIRTRLETPCSNCYLTAMEPDLVYVNGSAANYDTGVMLHHAVLGDAAQNDLTCGRATTIGWMGRRFFASGNERSKGVLPSPFGYRLGASDWWTGIFEIMNFSTEPKTVWFKFSVHYLPADASDVEPVVPVWLDENNCGSSEYSIPAGHSESDWDWTSNVTGRVVFAGGHVHNWGRKITLSNATRSTPMCKSVAGYGRNPAYKGNIESMSMCSWDRLGTVREGETLRISAVYDSPEARDDVMGIVLAYVYETDDLKGGTQAPPSMTNPPEGHGPQRPGHDHSH